MLDKVDLWGRLRSPCQINQNDSVVQQVIMYIYIHILYIIYGILYIYMWLLLLSLLLVLYYIYMQLRLVFRQLFCCKPPQFDWWKSGGGLYSHGVCFDQSLVLAQGIIGTALTPCPRKNARTFVTSRTFPSILQQFVKIPRMSKSLYQAQLLSHMSTCEASYHVSWKDEHRSTCRLNLS